MRVGLSTNALHAKSGYAIQARHVAHHLKDAGHEVAVFAFYGLHGAIMNIEGIPHYPGGALQYNADVLVDHCAHFGAEVLITISDLAHQDTDNILRLRAGGVQVLHWVPVDTSKAGVPGERAGAVSVLDLGVLAAGGGHPIAMSRHGHAQLAALGIEASYAPHGIDTTVFWPLGQAERDTAREQLGLAGQFVVGVNAMNKDSVRKGFFEAYAGFAKFRANKENAASCMIIHSENTSQNFRHEHVLDYLGLTAGTLGKDTGKAVYFTPDYEIKVGLVEDQFMAGWYNLADVYLCASWAEGFGIPVVEAQACGVPVIGTDASATTELTGAGWRISSEPKWNPLHAAVWRAPSIADIQQTLQRARRMWKGPSRSIWEMKQAKAREFALGYDVDYVWDEFWAPLVKRIEAGDFRAAAGLRQAGED